METIVQTAVNFSKIDLTGLTIEDATADSFSISITGDVYRTGPFYVTLAPMEIDLSGPDGIYGKLSLPEIKITPTQAKVSILKQRIRITSMPAFLALSKAIVQDKSITMGLLNGRTQVTVFRGKYMIDFNKTCTINGMDGPRTEFIDAREDGKQVTAKIWNPSPIEMDMGDATFDTLDAEGRKLAVSRGRIRITKGESKHALDMEVNPDENIESVDEIGKLELRGRTVAGDTWMTQTIVSYQTELKVSEQLKEIIAREVKKVRESRTSQAAAT